MLRSGQMADRIDALMAARRAKIEIAKFDDRIKVSSVDQVISDGNNWTVDLTYSNGTTTEKKRVLLDGNTAKVLAIQNPK